MDQIKRNKITILVNVHNRHAHLARQLDYIHMHYDHILVLDSSDHEYVGKSDYPNVKYHYYPKWEYIDKLADIIEKVETPYVQLCADDDFYIPASVGACAAFLEENSDYASAHGHYLSFRWDGRHYITMPIYKSFIGRNIKDNDAVRRLQAVFSPYMQLLYGVHRTRNLKDCFSLASSRKVENHRLVELLVSAIAVLNGKHKVLSVFYGMRETLYNSAGTFVPSVMSLTGDGQPSGEYERFISVIAEWLGSKEQGLERQKCLDLVTQIFETYLSGCDKKLSRIPQLLPVWLRVYINLFRSQRNKQEIMSHILNDRDELALVATYVKKYNITV